MPPIPSLTSVLAALVAVAVLLLARLLIRKACTGPANLRLEKPDLSQVKSRPLGQWVSHSFRMPQPPPYPSWSVAKTKPLPYRPFRYGPKYHITMGTRKINHHEWIELDNHYPSYHRERARRIVERREKCYGTTPEAYPAAIELLEHLVDYLPARYPSMFRRTAVGIDNLWSGETFNTVERPLAEDPIVICARLIQDDMAILIERSDGQYYLLSGFVALAGFWRLRDKFGMSLSEIHTSGNVPHYEEKLEKGMLNMFRRLKPEEMVARNNYYIQVDDGLAWSKSIGPEDAAADVDVDTVNWGTAERNTDPDTYFFRSERQTMWRMPKSGAIAFTFRTYFLPLKDIVQEDYVPGRLASAVRSWGEDVSKYKGKEIYEDVLLDWLDKKHQAQIENGLDLNREDEVRSYPF
ncbi:hypothetical protein PV11_09726 [Exophiala sideris]|uniref:Alpha-1,2-mannosyltransferase n=1 Tax=Exophiala sideris TaxID=1016849 RepID=A0A0D1YSS5_9EURO|nr:hypothetical protein PV11_09726 [Exophiala sideris]